MAKQLKKLIYSSFCFKLIGAYISYMQIPDGRSYKTVEPRPYRHLVVTVTIFSRRNAHTFCTD